MLKREAITLVDMETLDFPQYFLVLNAFRIVIDLKSLNSHIDAPLFSMFMLSSDLSTIKGGYYAFQIDLKDGYFHIPDSRKYL